MPCVHMSRPVRVGSPAIVFVRGPKTPIPGTLGLTAYEGALCENGVESVEDVLLLTVADMVELG